MINGRSKITTTFVFTIVAFLAVLLTVVPTGSDELDADGSWSSPDNMIWTVSGNTLTVTKGTGYGTDIAIAPTQAQLDQSGVENLVISVGITSYGASNLACKPTLKTVDLGDVKTIGNLAFGSCRSLTSVYMPEVKEIQGVVWGGAFRGCTHLTSVYMPKVETIGEDTFNQCTSLKTINLPNVKSIEEGGFSWCESLETIDMPNVESIGRYAFAGCGFMKVTLPASLISLHQRAIWSCPHLFEVVNLSSVPVYHESVMQHPRGVVKSIVNSETESTLKKLDSGLWYGRSNDPADPVSGMLYAVYHEGIKAILPETITDPEKNIDNEDYLITRYFDVGNDTTDVFIPHGFEISGYAFAGKGLTPVKKTFTDINGNKIQPDHEDFHGNYFMKDSGGIFRFCYGLEARHSDDGDVVLKDRYGNVIVEATYLITTATWSVDGSIVTFRDGGSVLYTITATPHPGYLFSKFLDNGLDMEPSGNAHRMIVSAFFTGDLSASSVTAHLDPDLHVRYILNGTAHHSLWDGSAVIVTAGSTMEIAYDEASLPRDTKVVIDLDGSTRTVDTVGGSYKLSDIQRNHHLRISLCDPMHTEYIEVTLGDSKGGKLSGPDSMILSNGAEWNVSGGIMGLHDSIVSYTIKSKADPGFGFAGFLLDGSRSGKSGVLHQSTVVTGNFMFQEEEEDEYIIFMRQMPESSESNMKYWLVVVAAAVSVITLSILMIEVYRKQ